MEIASSVGDKGLGGGVGPEQYTSLRNVSGTAIFNTLSHFSTPIYLPPTRAPSGRVFIKRF